MTDPSARQGPAARTTPPPPRLAAEVPRRRAGVLWASGSVPRCCVLSGVAFYGE